MDSLSRDFIEQIVSALDGEDVVAIGLTGSYARGTATAYSDVDIYRFGQQPAKDTYDRYTLRVAEGHLVSVTKATIEAKRADLHEPDAAIWAVPGLRQMQILLDKQGALAALKREAEVFQWEPLQSAADTYASVELMGYAEEVHKVLGSLQKNDRAAMLYATYGLVLGLSQVMLVQKGVLVESENVLLQRAQEAAGLDSEWSQHFRIAAGFDTLPEQPVSVRMRAEAGVKLYAETVNRLRAIIAPEHTEVIKTTFDHIAAFGGWLPD